MNGVPGRDQIARNLQVADAILAQKPQEITGWRLRVESLFLLGRHWEALQAVSRALAIHPGDAQLWNIQGLVQNALGRNDEALQSVRKATTLNPKNASAWISTGSILTALRRPEEALQAIDRAQALEPNNVVVHIARGEALGAMGRYPEALQAIDRALAIDPDNPFARAARQNLARMAQSGGPAQAMTGGGAPGEGTPPDPHAVLQEAEGALAQNAGDSGAWARKAWALVSLGRFPEALAACDQVLTGHPDDVFA